MRRMMRICCPKFVPQAALHKAPRGAILIADVTSILKFISVQRI